MQSKKRLFLVKKRKKLELCFYGLLRIGNSKKCPINITKLQHCNGLVFSCLQYFIILIILYTANIYICWLGDSTEITGLPVLQSNDHQRTPFVGQ